MEHKLPISLEDRKVLSRARKTYGATNQILVTIEELEELAKVCCKFPRYDNHETAREKLHDQAVDEVADVLIVLDHVFSLFDLDWEEVVNHIPPKIDRITRWMSKSNSMEQTTIDREVHEKKYGCTGCVFEFTQGKAGHCKTCKDQSGYKAPLPCDTCCYMGDVNNFAMGGACYNCIQTEGSMYKPKQERLKK